jgi:hypothetical protein
VQIWDINGERSSKSLALLQLLPGLERALFAKSRLVVKSQQGDCQSRGHGFRRKTGYCLEYPAVLWKQQPSLANIEV